MCRWWILVRNVWRCWRLRINRECAVWSDSAMCVSRSVSELVLRRNFAAVTERLFEGNLRMLRLSVLEEWLRCLERELEGDWLRPLKGTKCWRKTFLGDLSVTECHLKRTWEWLTNSIWRKLYGTWEKCDLLNGSHLEGNLRVLLKGYRKGVVTSQ